VARAVFDRTILAESEHTIRLEGNVYFPPDSVRWEHLRPSRSRTLCPWKGVARYHSLHTDEADVADVAWSYPHPSPLARRIRGYVAFWNGVRITDDRPARKGSS
jgi:uncharacterized protein (DUF427 family)